MINWSCRAARRPASHPRRAQLPPPTLPPPPPPHLHHLPTLLTRFILPLLLLLLLTPAKLSPGLAAAAKRHRASPPPSPAPPFAPDPLLPSLLTLAQVPALDLTASQHQLQSQQRTHDQQQQQHEARAAALRDGDFVFATGTCRERMPLARSTRAWRRGIRAFMLTDVEAPEALARLNAEGAGGGGDGGGGDGAGGGGGGCGPPHNEAYAYFPDDRAAALGGFAHGTKQGDTRAAVAPFAAHRHFGETYKWMLYGDDDTLFFMEPIKRMLADYDPELPIALSDNLWYFGQQPNAHAPRCLPCHMMGVGADQTGAELGQGAGAGNGTSQPPLPTLAELAQTTAVRDHIRKWLQMRSSNVSDADVEEIVREAKEVPGRLFAPRPACPVCTPHKACNQDTNSAPCNPSVAHGGAGMIFSVGLMRSLPYPDALACIRSFRGATGGDALVSSCLWRHDVAFTDPGPLLLHAYDPHFHVFGGKAGLGYLWDPIGMMTHGRCTTKCRWMLRNTVSLHLKGRHFRSWRVGSVLMWGVAHAAQAAQEFLDLASRDGGVSWKHLPYGYDIDDAAGFAPYMALASPPTAKAVIAGGSRGDSSGE